MDSHFNHLSQPQCIQYTTVSPKWGIKSQRTGTSDRGAQSPAHVPQRDHEQWSGSTRTQCIVRTSLNSMLNVSSAKMGMAVGKKEIQSRMFMK